MHDVREEFEEVAENLRCFFHAEMEFEDVVDLAGGHPEHPDEAALFVCPAKGCEEEKVVRL